MKTALGLALWLGLAVAGAQTVTNGNFGAARKIDTPAKKPSAAPSTAKPAAQRSVKSYPFHGYLDSLAEDGSSLSLRGKAKTRVILVTSETRIFKGSTPSELKSAAAGERITGSVFRNEQGQEQALTVRIGGMAK